MSLAKKICRDKSRTHVDNGKKRKNLKFQVFPVSKLFQVLKMRKF